MAEFDKDRLNKILDDVGDDLGDKKDTIREALNSGSMDKLLKNIKPSDAKKINSILSDKAQTKAILNSPQAQELIKKLTGK